MFFHNQLHHFAQLLTFCQSDSWIPTWARQPSPKKRILHTWACVARLLWVLFHWFSIFDTYLDIIPCTSPNAWTLPRRDAPMISARMHRFPQSSSIKTNAHYTARQTNFYYREKFLHSLLFFALNSCEISISAHTNTSGVAVLVLDKLSSSSRLWVCEKLRATHPRARESAFRVFTCSNMHAQESIGSEREHAADGCMKLAQSVREKCTWEIHWERRSARYWTLLLNLHATLIQRYEEFLIGSKSITPNENLLDSLCLQDIFK